MTIPSTISWLEMNIASRSTTEPPPPTKFAFFPPSLEFVKLRTLRILGGDRDRPDSPDTMFDPLFMRHRGVLRVPSLRCVSMERAPEARWALAPIPPRMLALFISQHIVFDEELLPEPVVRVSDGVHLEDAEDGGAALEVLQSFMPYFSQPLHPPHSQEVEAFDNAMNTVREYWPRDMSEPRPAPPLPFPLVYAQTGDAGVATAYNNTSQGYSNSTTTPTHNHNIACGQPPPLQIQQWFEAMRANDQLGTLLPPPATGHSRSDSIPSLTPSTPSFARSPSPPPAPSINPALFYDMDDQYDSNGGAVGYSGEHAGASMDEDDGFYEHENVFSYENYEPRDQAVSYYAGQSAANGVPSSSTDFPNFPQYAKPAVQYYPGGGALVSNPSAAFDWSGQHVQPNNNSISRQEPYTAPLAPLPYAHTGIVDLERGEAPSPSISPPSAHAQLQWHYVAFDRDGNEMRFDDAESAATPGSQAQSTGSTRTRSKASSSVDSQAPLSSPSTASTSQPTTRFRGRKKKDGDVHRPPLVKPAEIETKKDYVASLINDASITSWPAHCPHDTCNNPHRTYRDYEALASHVARCGDVECAFCRDMYAFVGRNHSAHMHRAGLGRDECPTMQTCGGYTNVGGVYAWLEIHRADTIDAEVNNPQLGGRMKRHLGHHLRLLHARIKRGEVKARQLVDRAKADLQNGKIPARECTMPRIPTKCKAVQTTCEPKSRSVRGTQATKGRGGRCKA
ncbi:hypothetical protein EXIGLDRAFT_761369 [Exidia glandulosa HHB12029]|uniref:Uncharacterized protein n=1 Tax=Exidia glandulosa HHB12029 TaxID=1314781 RepID=A0A165NJ40_EXIGL|nr:hypothetical protein EXIGLDRAFT_761369 [Exidia glandulosa HHB12029]